MESCPNPLILGTDIAARTKNIRIGQAANIITFHNPIRLAEDIATLDHLSNGRLESRNWTRNIMVEKQSI